MERLPNIHPGEILRLDFLEPMGISPYRLAKDIGVGRVRVSGILSGKRDITPDTAIRLGLYFGIEPEFWLNLQAHYTSSKPYWRTCRGTRLFRGVQH